MTSSNDAKTLLVELGTEELPPKALLNLAQAFADETCARLNAAEMVPSSVLPEVFATPRRLALRIPQVVTHQTDRVQQRRGPAVAAAFDGDGNPTKALQGFARSCGVEPDALQRVSTEKGEWIVFEQTVSGQALTFVLNDVLADAVKRLPIPKRMRWGSRDVEFVRPVHWLVALHGEDVLDVTVLGLTAGRETQGHRFHSGGPLSIDDASNYEQVLRESGRVEPDFETRRNLISQQVESLATSVDAIAVVNDDLLKLVTGLVEWPRAILGKFDQKFLSVPSEVLISSMQDHQKYFHLTDPQGQLMPAFITVSNIESTDENRVRAGNERVLRARLSDGEFFWHADLKKSLAEHGANLDGLLFHKKLGSVAQKAKRIAFLADWLADKVGADKEQVARASLLCKADLVTDMVGEFPELQGVIGRYYAEKQNEKSEVSQAIETHYWPRFAGDELPVGKVSLCIALADRVDSLVGIFAAGEIPTGDKDPYGLRRAALGVNRILIENRLDIDLHELVRVAQEQFADAQYGASKLDLTVNQRVYEYVTERLKSYYHEVASSEQVNAVLIRQSSSPFDIDRRIRALVDFYQAAPDSASALAAANKRIANLLAKSEDATATYNAEKLSEPAEQALARAFNTVLPDIETSFASSDYSAGLKSLATLRTPIDTFFDEVMVLVDDDAVRLNRLGLLSSIREQFLRVADISSIRLEST
ncbi:MAG: glycine--tRNA ligase subunit beta [Pseudomonadota bacterium]